ncbi:DUF4339 domain-containing protein [Gimesia chilikensis]|uniref:GYF domain-containing protein n=1 Tax=Gimesia chilikensis TaxID=2605989 RepID=A0A517PYT0_9PLAN|nr:DUF4339 domain-containing protein [Gimesia chilikensis]QDT24523.1 hypothetical protein HG66A1_63570 [Gimesia chilikensis]
MAQDSWYYRQSEETTSGPISFEELFSMAHARKLTPQMEVRVGEGGNWFPAADIGGLFDARESGETELSLDDFSIVDSSFGMEENANLPSMEGFSIVEEEDKLSSELESQLPRFATLEAVRSKHQKVQWYCRVLNHELGPMSAEDLMQMLFDGELAPNDEVKSSAEPEWVPARTVVFLSSSGSDLDVIDAEDMDADQIVPTSGETETEEAEAEVSESSRKKKSKKKQAKEEEKKAAEPPKPPILKLRSRQKWYCKLGGMGYGPIEAHKIKMWAEQQRVEPTDLLKLGRKGEWFEAWQIEALQLKKPEPKKEEAAAPAETESAEATTAAATPAAAVPPPASSPAASPVPMAATPPPSRPAKPQIKVARSNPFEALGPMMDPKILGGVGGAIVLAAILYFVPLGDLFAPGGDAELAKFKAIHQEFLALQQKQASDAEWSSFKNKVKSEMDPLIKELESSAGSDRPQLQQMLWAGRDYLPGMLDNARTEPSPDQEKFEKHLKEAERIINE